MSGIAWVRVLALLFLVWATPLGLCFLIGKTEVMMTIVTKAQDY